VLARPQDAAAMGRAARDAVADGFDNDRNLRALLQRLGGASACGAHCAHAAHPAHPAHPA